MGRTRIRTAVSVKRGAAWAGVRDCSQKMECVVFCSADACDNFSVSKFKVLPELIRLIDVPKVLTYPAYSDH